MTTTIKASNQEFDFFNQDIDVNKYPIGLPNGVETEACEYNFRKISQWYKEVGDRTGQEFMDLSDEEKEAFKIPKYQKKIRKQSVNS